jgi:hypothetical protein
LVAAAAAAAAAEKAAAGKAADDAAIAYCKVRYSSCTCDGDWTSIQFVFFHVQRQESRRHTPIHWACQRNPLPATKPLAKAVQTTDEISKVSSIRSIV